jgi:hypothetical protein
MIITAKDTTGLVTNNLGNESCKLGIKASGWAHLSTILRDSLYSDKILAPIREYSTNAMDAHVESGQAKRPILVKLPNEMSPVFSVRDYGFGMSEERIWQVFANYGESTKRNSNEQTGMLGIGSKSAFAYTDNFTIVNRHAGKKSIFMCHVAGSAEGDLVRVSSEPTMEEDGLEIQIPVSTKDVSTWVSKAKSFFSHWEVIPIFEGNVVVIDKIDKLFEATDWYITEKDSREAMILMGNICYPVKFHQLKFSSDSSKFSQLFNSCGLVFKASIGDVDIAASREGLQYTAKTNSFFVKKAESVCNELKKIVQSEVDSCKSTFDKKKLIKQYSDYYSKYYRIHFISSEIVKDMGGSSYLLADRWTSNDINNTGLLVNCYQKSRRGNRRVRPLNFGIWEIECGNNIRYISLKKTDKHYLNRIAALIERAPASNTVKSVYTFEVTDQVKFDAWKKKVNFDIPLTEFDTLPVVKTSELYGSSGSTSSRSYNYNPKASKKMFLLDRSVKSGIPSDYFVPMTVDKSDKNVLYVTIDNWNVSYNQIDISVSNFVSMISDLETVLNIKIPKIFAVRKSMATKLNSQFISFETHLKNLFNNKKHVESLKKMIIADELRSISIGSRYENHGFMNYNMFRIMFSKVDVNKFVDSESLALSLKEIICDVTPQIKTLRGFKQYVPSKEVTESIEMVKSLMSQFIKKYPLLCIFDEYQISHKNSPEFFEKLVEYVNFVDDREKLVVS